MQTALLLFFFTIIFATAQEINAGFALFARSPKLLKTIAFATANKKSQACVMETIDIYLSRLCHFTATQNLQKGLLPYVNLNLDIAFYSYGNDADEILFKKILEIIRGGGSVRIVIGDNMFSGQNTVKNLLKYYEDLDFYAFLQHLSELGVKIKFYNKFMHSKLTAAYTNKFPCDCEVLPLEQKRIYTSSETAVIHSGSANASKTARHQIEDGIGFFCVAPRFKIMEDQFTLTSPCDRLAVDIIQQKMDYFNYIWFKGKPAALLKPAT